MECGRVASTTRNPEHEVTYDCEVAYLVVRGAR
jgi:hypothetical protein